VNPPARHFKNRVLAALPRAEITRLSPVNATELCGMSFDGFLCCRSDTGQTRRSSGGSFYALEPLGEGDE
jgi:hypothetical protein